MNVSNDYTVACERYIHPPGLFYPRKYLTGIAKLPDSTGSATTGIVVGTIVPTRWPNGTCIRFYTGRESDLSADWGFRAILLRHRICHGLLMET